MALERLEAADLTEGLRQLMRGAKKGGKKGKAAAPTPAHTHGGGSQGPSSGGEDQVLPLIGKGHPPSMQQRLAKAKAAGFFEAVSTSASGLAFMPSKNFSGARPGYVFKKGALGLGYYRDHLPKATKSKPGLKPSGSAMTSRKFRETSATAAQIPRSKAPIIPAGGGLSAKRKAQWSDDDDDDDDDGHQAEKRRPKSGKATGKGKALPGRLRKKLARDSQR